MTTTIGYGRHSETRANAVQQGSDDVVLNWDEKRVILREARMLALGTKETVPD